MTKNTTKKADPQQQTAQPEWPTGFADQMACNCEEALLGELVRLGAPQRAFDLLHGMAYFNLYSRNPYAALVPADFAEVLKAALHALE